MAQEIAIFDANSEAGSGGIIVRNATRVRVGSGAQRLIIDKVAVVYEGDRSQQRAPYWGFFIRITATGGSSWTVSDGGFRFEAGSAGQPFRTETGDPGNPFAGLTFSGSNWYKIVGRNGGQRVDLVLHGSSDPTASTNLSASSINVERFLFPGARSRYFEAWMEYDRLVV